MPGVCQITDTRRLLMQPIQLDEIRNRVKRVISKITNIPTNEIPDKASYSEDLALDSLSALEVIVDVEYEFQLKVPEAELANIKTVEETVLLVERHLSFATV